MAFPLHTFMDTQRERSTTKQEAYGVYYAVTKWNYYLHESRSNVVCNDHKPLARFLSGKNAINKVNRWGLELSTYNITFEWIVGSLKIMQLTVSPRLVDLPQDRHATVQMLTATNYDGPAFHTRSRTAPCNKKEDLTLQPKIYTVTTDIPRSNRHTRCHTKTVH